MTIRLIIALPNTVRKQAAKHSPQSAAKHKGLRARN